ncbi:MAG: ROK family transcriptional regulator [Cellulomonas sp.]
MTSTTSGGGPARISSRAALLDAVRAAGQISRVDLSRETGLTGATVSTVVRRLIDDGLVIESGRSASTGGKPATLLTLNADARFAVGVHLDQGALTYVVSNLSGAIVGRWRRPGAGAAPPGTVVERIGVEIELLVARLGIEPRRILGLGVVSAGPLTSSIGLVMTPPAMEAWTNYPLASALSARLGRPVLLENDATAAAIGEYWAGPLEAGSVFAALYMGSGIGAGVMVDGAVYRGASGNTGEVGHICVAIDGPVCWCGNRGCVEALGGPASVVDAARTTELLLPGVGVAENFAAVARAATRGEPTARSLLLNSARYLALAAQALANILDLDRVVLTGPSFALAGSLYVPVIQQRLDESFFARGSHRVEVVISNRAAEAAAVGGAALVLQSELAPRSSNPRGPLEPGPPLRVPAPVRVLSGPSPVGHAVPATR